MQLDSSTIITQHQKIAHPLFQTAFKSILLFHNSPIQSPKQQTRDLKSNQVECLCIPSLVSIPPSILQQNICPIWSNQDKDYIVLNGQSLMDLVNQKVFFKQQQIYHLLIDLSSVFMGIHQEGFNVGCIVEQAVQRYEGKFTFLYHPLCRQQYDLAFMKGSRWQSFYLSPQELLRKQKEIEEINNISQAHKKPQGNQRSNSKLNNLESIFRAGSDKLSKNGHHVCHIVIPTEQEIVFSLGAMILNLMVEQDRDRKIYQQEVLWIKEPIIKQKIYIASRMYSKKLLGLIERCLVVEFRNRMTLKDLMRQLQGNATIQVKSSEIGHIQSDGEAFDQLINRAQLQYSNTRMNSKINTTQDLQHQLIESPTFSANTTDKPFNFNRNTFGSQNYDDKDYSPESKFHTQSKYIKLEQATQQTQLQTLSQQNLQEQLMKVPGQDEQCVKPIFDQSIIQSQIQYARNNLQQQLQQLQLAGPFQSQTLIARFGLPTLKINGDTYYGPIANNKRNGLGLQMFQNNDFYYGQFKNDLFHGEGYYSWSKGEHFHGIFREGMKTKGTYQGKATYVGEIQKSKKHGYGMLISKYQKYQGYWLNGKKHGIGIVFYITKDIFIGQWKQGHRMGYGVYITPHCRLYGEWQDMRSLGDVVCQNKGSEYRGEMCKFQKHGAGKLVYESGTQLEGIFVEDQFTKGTIRYKNGDCYVGMVSKMKRHGQGIYTYAGGAKAQGVWVEGKLTQ